MTPWSIWVSVWAMCLGSTRIFVGLSLTAITLLWLSRNSWMPTGAVGAAARGGGAPVLRVILVDAPAQHTEDPSAVWSSVVARAGVAFRGAEKRVRVAYPPACGGAGWWVVCPSGPPMNDRSPKWSYI